MRYLILLVPLALVFRGLSYGLWAWRQGNRFGGFGVSVYSFLALATVIYMLFFREAY